MSGAVAVGSRGDRNGFTNVLSIQRCMRILNPDMYTRRSGFDSCAAVPIGCVASCMITTLPEEGFISTRAVVVRHEVPVSTTRIQNSRELWGYRRNLNLLRLWRQALNFNFDNLEDRVDMFRNRITHTHSTDILQTVPLHELHRHIRGTSSYVQSVVSSISETCSCAVCLDDIQETTVTPCGHKYCRECALGFFNFRSQCPLCRASVNRLFLLTFNPQQQQQMQSQQHDGSSSPQPNTYAPPTPKFEAAISCIINFVNDGRRPVVFCDTSYCAGRVAAALRSSSIEAAVLSENCSMRNKHKAVERFQQGDFSTIILTYHSASTGLNLQCSDTIVMVDVPLFDSVYQQSVGRIIRHGQMNAEVEVHMFSVLDTCEMWMPHSTVDEFAWRDVMF